MNREKIVGSALVILNLILFLFCVIRYVQSDKTPPRFLLEATDIIYVPGMDSAALIQGISANDNEDGDVTDRIVIEKITEKEREQTAVVYYAVCDKSGNVAKLSKLFHAEYPEPEYEDTQDGEEEQSATGDDSSQESEEQPLDAEDDGETAEEGENGDASEDAEEEEADQEEEPEAEPEVTEPEEEQAQNDEPEEAPPEQQRTERANTGAPELVLGSSEITIDAGTNPPWTEIITTMRDDKDDYATLYYNLHVSQYNRSRPGTYPVTVYVEDSDGNRSQEVPFTIIVR